MKIYNPIVGYKTNKQIKKRGRSAKSKLNQKRKSPQCDHDKVPWVMIQNVNSNAVVSKYLSKEKKTTIDDATDGTWWLPLSKTQWKK